MVVPSLSTRRFLEPWGLVCNEAMLAGTPVVTSNAVGAAAGGLVVQRRDRPHHAGRRRPQARGRAPLLLGDEGLRTGLGDTGRSLAATFRYEAAADAFGTALQAVGALR